MDPVAGFDLGTLFWQVVYILSLGARHDNYRFCALCCVVIASFSKSSDCTYGPSHEIITTKIQHVATISSQPPCDWLGPCRYGLCCCRAMRPLRIRRNTLHCSSQYYSSSIRCFLWIPLPGQAWLGRCHYQHRALVCWRCRQCRDSGQVLCQHNMSHHRHL